MNHPLHKTTSLDSGALNSIQVSRSGTQLIFIQFPNSNLNFVSTYSIYKNNI